MSLFPGVLHGLVKSWSAITMLIRGSNALTVVNVTAILGKDIALR